MKRKTIAEKAYAVRYAIQARLEIPAKKRWLQQNGFTNPSGRSWLDQNGRIAVIDSQVKELTLYDMTQTAERTNTNTGKGRGLFG